MSRDEDQGRVEIRIGGVLDVPVAERLAALLRAADDLDVRIDVNDVVEFDDVGVVVLGQAIAGRDGPTTVMGLHEHHLRLLRHLGIECRGANLAAGVVLV